MVRSMINNILVDLSSQCKVIMKTLIQITLMALSLSGYFSQWLLLRREKNIGSFSIFITFIMITCSLLKLFFWFIKPFALFIIFQALCLIAIHLCITYQCVRLKYGVIKSEGNWFNKFWRWSSFKEFIYFLGGLSIFMSFVIFFSLKFQLYIIGDIIGYVSTIIQISLAFPQLYESYHKKSVEGVSSTMIILWIFADTLKTAYFWMNNQPFQFLLTGSVQILLDLVLVGQIIIYSKAKSPKKIQ